MSQRRFIDGPFCRGGAHCELCRDHGAKGETFRQGLRGLALPVVAEGEPPHRFPCPAERGAKPWGWKASTAKCETCDGSHLTSACPIPREYDGNYRNDSKGSEGCGCA